MRSGGLRHPVQIQRKIQVGASSMGQPNYVWQDWRTPFAEVQVKRGREHFDPTTQRRFSEEVWQFRCRYEDVVGLDPTMRLLHDGMVFDIKAPLPEGQRRGDAIIECTLQGGAIGGLSLMAYIEDVIPDGVSGEAYAGFTVKVAGGTAPYTFSAAGLPAGLSISSSTGEVSGTPTAAGTSAPVFTVTDAVGEQHSMPAPILTIGS